MHVHTTGAGGRSLQLCISCTHVYVCVHIYLHVLFMTIKFQSASPSLSIYTAVWYILLLLPCPLYYLYTIPLLSLYTLLCVCVVYVRLYVLLLSLYIYCCVVHTPSLSINIYCCVV